MHAGAALWFDASLSTALHGKQTSALESVEMPKSASIAALATTALITAGCGESREDEAASFLSDHLPNASEVRCTGTSGDRFSCDAIVDGKPTTFTVLMSGSGSFSLSR
jgi:hypothetical protein